MTVSIGDFRNNLADYLDRVRLGDKIILRDEKKNRIVAEVATITSGHDQKAYYKNSRAMLAKVAGIFTAKNHPEWENISKVDLWLRQTRKQSERSFDVSS